MEQNYVTVTYRIVPRDQNFVLSGICSAGLFQFQVTYVRIDLRVCIVNNI